MRRLGSETLCFSGLARKPAPKLVLSAPDGAQTEIRAGRRSALSYDADVDVDSDGDVDAVWSWSFRPGLIGDQLSELGTFGFRLTGRPAAAVTPGAEVTFSGAVTVVPAARPEMLFTHQPRHAFDDLAIRPGGRVTAQLAGYRPGSRHFLTVYGPAETGSGPGKVEPGLKPIADLPEIVIPGSGEATIHWTSPRTAEAGEYGIWVQSTPVQPGGCSTRLCHMFELEE